MYRINYENMTGLTVCVLISLALLKCVHCHKVVVKMGKKREECQVQVYYSCYVAVCPSSINAESEPVARKRAKADAKRHRHRRPQKDTEKRGQYYTVCAYYHQAQHQRPDSG